MKSGSAQGGIAIRRAEIRDAEAIVDLFVTVNRDLAPSDLADTFEAYIALCLEHEIRPYMDYYDPAVGNGLWIAEAEGEVVAMCGLERSSLDDVELRRMYVAPGRRRGGLARRLLRHAEETAAGEGYARMILSTAEFQTAAIALYESEGFRLVRREEAEEKSNKTIGGGIVRFHYEKDLPAPD